MCGVNEVAEKVEDRPSQVLCGLGVSSENRDCPAPGSREMTLYPVNLEKWGQEGRGRERVWELFLVRRFCCSAVCTPAGSAEPRFPHQAQHAVSECEVPGCLPFSAQALPPPEQGPQETVSALPHHVETEHAFTYGDGGAGCGGQPRPACMERAVPPLAALLQVNLRGLRGSAWSQGAVRLSIRPSDAD